MGAGLLLIISGILLALNRDQPAPSLTSVPDEHDEGGIPYPEVPRIPLDEALVRYEAADALFIDVRDQDDYEAAHIPGALSLPLAELETRYRELPRQAELLTYCT